jgi:carbonic anhydrase
MSQTSPIDSTMTPQLALRLLQEGNKRFVSGVRSVESFLATPEKVRHLAEVGQSPFAAVLGCADSRVPAEIIFDRGLGDLFVPRVAGNVCSAYMLASLEYAVENLGVRLGLVLGHTYCGAVGAALDMHAKHEPAESKNLEALVQRIYPAVDAVTCKHPHATREELIQRIVYENVSCAIRDIMRESPLLKTRIDEGRFKLEGAVCELKTGEVRFFSEL